MKKRIIIGVLASILIIIIGLISFFNVSLGSASKDTTPVVFTVNKGESTSTILNNLKTSNLIKNTTTAKIYVKLAKLNNLQAGSYNLNRTMSAKEILKTINAGKIIDDSITVTFVEGKRLTYYAKVIANNFPYTEEEVINTLSDQTFLQELIDKYWFITNDILNKNIYYPLEGYIFPDTYSFQKNASIKSIIMTLLNEMNNKLSNYQEQIEKSNLSIHEILTLASIVELEGASSKDRSGVAGVFYNRLNDGWTLGSDVTTYYAEQKDFDVELTIQAYNACNSYNTRGTCFTGLPVGPICSAGLESLEATINPTIGDYYYFVADKNKNTYFAKDANEFEKIKSELKRDNLWYTYW